MSKLMNNVRAYILRFYIYRLYNIK